MIEEEKMFFMRTPAAVDWGSEHEIPNSIRILGGTIEVTSISFEKNAPSRKYNPVGLKGTNSDVKIELSRLVSHE